MLSTWEKSKINEVIGFRWTWITIRWVNKFSISVMDMRNNTLRNAGFRSREKYASICAKPSKCGYTSQSQETAELYVQVITSIFIIFKRESDMALRRSAVDWFGFGDYFDSSITVSHEYQVQCVWLVNIRISIFEFSGIRPVFYSDQTRKLN